MNDREIRKKALHDAAREVGMDGHVTEIEFKKDANTRAEQMAVRFAGLPMECKNSYLYCDILDACFYFAERDGEPQCTLSCVVGLWSHDIDWIEKAIDLMKSMLQAMNDHRTRIEMEELGL